jgi:hypothetical protein
MKRSRTAALEDLLRSVSEPQLIFAIACVLAHRRRQAEGLAEDAPMEVDVNPVEFLETCPTWQIELIKVIALELDPWCEEMRH